MEDRKTAVETLHRERIMDASERLFLEKGFQGTTIADISGLRIIVDARFTRTLKTRMRFCAALWRAGCGCCGMS